MNKILRWFDQFGRTPFVVRIWQRPLLIVLFAHTLFSIGIWNARDGYGEETTNVAAAFRILQTHQPTKSIYNDLIALSLRYLSPDPIAAVIFIKYFSSLLSTVAVYLALSSFSDKLRRGAILFACFVWIASSLDAPYLQSTSLSLFTFAIMLFGIDCLLLCGAHRGLLEFYTFGFMAALLRPEYYLPLVLMTFALLGQAGWSGVRMIEMRFGWPRYLAVGGAIMLVLVCLTVVWVKLPDSVSREGRHLDKYALLGLGQCYADFYHREHPKEALSPMTEYRELLDAKFGKPAGFCAAIANNPSEALRYFFLNGAHNVLKSLPSALIDRYRERTKRYHHGIIYWAVRAILLFGAFLGARRLVRVCQDGNRHSIRPVSAMFFQSSPGWKLLLFLLLLTPSFVAIPLLVGTSRYYLCWVPLFYLGVAYSADSLLWAFELFRYEAPLVFLALVILCAPNFLKPRPNEEFDTVRQIGAKVKANPTIAAAWAEPDVVLALSGNARPISLWDGIRREDLVAGKIDILLIDQDFRNSKTWLNQRDFFGQFERHPESWGFRKAEKVLPNGLKIYFRPNHDAFSCNPSQDQNLFFRQGPVCAFFDASERTPPMRN